MARLIDADALFAEFENVGWYNNADRDEIAEPLILQSPTIDAVSVVRCKECKWAKANGAYQWCGRLDSTARITADDYCSYGERKESE